MTKEFSLIENYCLARAWQNYHEARAWHFENFKADEEKASYHGLEAHKFEAEALKLEKALEEQLNTTIDYTAIIKAGHWVVRIYDRQVGGEIYSKVC